MNRFAPDPASRSCARITWVVNVRATMPRFCFVFCWGFNGRLVAALIIPELGICLRIIHSRCNKDFSMLGLGCYLSAREGSGRIGRLCSAEFGTAWLQITGSLIFGKLSGNPSTEMGGTRETRLHCATFVFIQSALRDNISGGGGATLSEITPEPRITEDGNIFKQIVSHLTFLRPSINNR